LLLRIVIGEGGFRRFGLSFVASRSTGACGVGGDDDDNDEDDAMLGGYACMSIGTGVLALEEVEDLDSRGVRSCLSDERDRWLDGDRERASCGWLSMSVCE
jgi:hypothetical protein